MKDRNNITLTRGTLISLTPDPRYNIVSDVRGIFLSATLTSRPNKYKVEYIPLSSTGVNTAEHLDGGTPDYYSKTKWYSLYTTPDRIMKITEKALTGKEYTNYGQIKKYLNV